MKYPLAAALLLLAQLGRAQTQTLAASVPLELPLYFYMSVPPQHPSPDDSLARQVYVQQGVRSVLKLRPYPEQPSRAADTVEYCEYDRRGNLTLRVAPPNRRQYRRYDAQNRLVELTQPTNELIDQAQHDVYDPEQRRYQVFSGPPGHLAPHLTTTLSQRGDTALTTTLFAQPLLLEGREIRRAELRSFPFRGDTTRSYVAGFDAAGQLVRYDVLYRRHQQGRQMESGRVSYAAALRAHGAQVQRLRRQGLSDAAIVARYARRWRGQVQPEHYQHYDAAGWLVRTEQLKMPDSTAETYGSADGGRLSISMRVTTNLASQRVVRRNQRGQVEQQEITIQRNDPAAPPQVFRSIFTYDANGLLTGETSTDSGSGAPPRHYEYRYTRYR
ncbi:hypothetical protein LJ737_10370 [Hymenobacter sp. 15J16-1T3B]|uniref:hypothetical protein n=1 Tax=Hymenobacter sp. 15J16-1T3B TaxID=2886941 RepID=UPI001D127FBC|nr:hypothetical protein [Hymenobacter sp. 15J16-1T3B]MCC3157645.1 hypothetical protein [Hymenobacter sp. 15J16-1T3B]